jgi:glycosyltransferase involved in cell wall biosynthesis
MHESRASPNYRKKIMEVYFEISDIIDWKANHLSGIQRTAVGILNGLIESDLDIKLIAYNEVIKGFYLVASKDISPELSKHFLDKTKKQILTRSQKNEVVIEAPSNTQQHIYQFDSLNSKPSRLKLMLVSMSKRILYKVSFVKKITIGSVIAINQLIDLLTKKNINFSKNDIILFFGANWLIEKRNQQLHELSKGGVNLYTIVYDLIPIKKHEWVSSDTAKSFDKWANTWLRCSKAVFTISEYTKNEILDHVKQMSMPAPDIIVLRLADSINKKIMNQVYLPKYVPDASFYIFVSTVDLRKNQQILFDAWKFLQKKLISNTPYVICIGSIAPKASSLIEDVRNDNNVGEYIKFLHDVSDEELEWYYSNCKATIYPSFYEGWGLPVGESLGRGKLCLASNATSIPEIGGELVQYFDPTNPAELANLVERTLIDNEWVESCENRIKNEFVQTDWVDTARQVINTINNNGSNC